MKTKINSFGPAPDAAEQLRRWDAGETIWTIDMGGMGSGYEQAIQILAIEITRDNLNKPIPKDDKEWRTWGDETLKRLDDDCGGFSGAQFGAAKQIALRWLREGPAALLKAAPADRHIQASKFWPKAPAIQEHSQ